LNHSKIDISHSLEPLKAVQFVKDSSVSNYLNRKSKVQKLKEFLSVSIENCKGYKNKILQVFQETYLKLEESKEIALKELENIEKDLDLLSEKVTKAQFELKLDLSDKIFRIIEENDYEGIEKIVKNLEIFTVTFNLEMFKNFIEIKNNLGSFNNDYLKIYEHFEKNQQNMPESIKGLFKDALDGVEKDRIFIGDDYKYVAKDLSVVIGIFTKLKSLDVSRAGLGSDGCKILFSSTGSLSQLSDINIGENYILDEGCKYLCNSLSSFPSLESLFLHKNALTEISGQLLSYSLHSTPHLKLLSLNQNSISDEGLIYLCDILPTLSEFEALGLQKTQLSSKSIPFIIKILSKDSLQDLSLDDNDINDEGAKLLLPILTKKTKNLKLYIRNNKITETLKNTLNQVNPQVSVVVRYSIY
jgi:hypothetical protein